MFLFIVYIVVIFYVIINSKNKRVKDTRLSSVREPVSKEHVIRNKSSYNPADDMLSSANDYTVNEFRKKHSNRDSLLEFEDKNNDWLACQIREESKAAQQVSDMLGLKYNHMRNCDAFNIKVEHSLHCDANGIDNGLRKGWY